MGKRAKPTALPLETGTKVPAGKLKQSVAANGKTVTISETSTSIIDGSGNLTPMKMSRFLSRMWLRR